MVSPNWISGYFIRYDAQFGNVVVASFVLCSEDLSRLVESRRVLSVKTSTVVER